MPRRRHRGCLVVGIHKEACMVRFGQRAAVVASCREIGTTVRGETVVAEMDADGWILGFELLGNKPCQSNEAPRTPDGEALCPWCGEGDCQKLHGGKPPELGEGTSR